MSHIIVYKIKDECVNNYSNIPRVGYVNVKKNIHYSCDGYLNLENAQMSISMKYAPAYEDVETFCTKEEYSIICAKGDPFKEPAAVKEIFNKYFGGDVDDKNYAAFASIVEAEERQLIKERCNCNDETAKDIQWCMPYGYIDVDTIGYIYDSVEEIAIEFMVDCYDLPDAIMNCIDFKKMGNEIVDDGMQYFELEDDRIVLFYM